MLELSNISLSINKNKILDDINLKIGDGEFFAILGPSGSGKTSLLSVIAGLLKQDSGSIVISGLNVTNTAPNKRNIGIVFQNFFVYPHLNVYENIRYPLRYTNLYKKEDVPIKIKEVADILSISHLLKRRSFELSGGEKQRVALARAIIKSPSLFLLDEPLSSLDYQLRLKIRTEIRNLHNTLKKTFVYVTHDQAEAFYLADRVAIINKGKLVQVGQPQELLDRPNTIFAAKFVHSNYNEISTEISHEGGAVYLESQLGRIPIENETTKSTINSYKHVTAFIKCQDIHVDYKEAENTWSNIIQFNTRIIDILYLSDLYLIILDNGLRMTTFNAGHQKNDVITTMVDKTKILLYGEQCLLGAIG